MFSIRTTVTALLLAAAGIAQAAEISEGPKPVSTRERVAVQSEARAAHPSNELYDGTSAMKPAAATSAKTREQIRMEAVESRTLQQQLALRDYLGGM